MILFKKLLNNNKGLSLVELIVTIAIMSIITAGIGAAVVSATKNYNKGTSEVSIQTSGQNVTNILSNLVIDSANAYSSVDESQGSGSDLFIKDINGKYYAIHYVANCNSNGTGSIYYGEGTDCTSALANATLVLTDNVAENGFVADTSEYKYNYTVHITLDLDFPGANRNFRSSFSVASRNAAADSQYIDNLDGAVIISETQVLIEPNEDGNVKDSLTVACKVMTSGNVSNSGLSYIVVDELNDVTAANPANNINVTCGLTVTYDATIQKFVLVANENLGSQSGNLYIKVTTAAVDPSTGMAYDSKWITVNIRKVSAATITKDKTLSTSSTNQEGSIHVITGNLVVSNGDRKYALSSDNDYAETDVTPFEVIWTASCTGKNGRTIDYYIDYIKDSDGNNITSSFLSANGYKGKSGQTFTIKLKNQVPKGEVLSFVMTPMHPSGIVNYAGSTYVTNKASLASYNNGVATAKTYPCSPAVYKITSGFFDEISDYQRGNVLQRIGFGNCTAEGVYSDIFKETHDTYEAMKKAGTVTDEHGNSVAEVCEWLTKFKNNQVPFSVGYFYRIKDYTNDLNGNQISDGWSQYRDMTCDGTQFKFDKQAFPSNESGVLNGGMTNRLNADTYQKVEFVVVLYDESSKKILWPAYSELEDYGFGSADKHCGLGWSINNIAESVTEDYSTYATTFDIVPARIEYYENGNVLGVGTHQEMIGSSGSPLILGDGLNDAWVEYEQGKWVGLDYKEYQQRIAGILMKNSGSGWSKVAYFGEPGGIPQKYECTEGGFKVGSNNHSFTFDTQNAQQPTDYTSVWRVAPIIYEWKLGYIKEEEGIFSRNVYYDKDHTYTYLLSGGNLYDDPLQGAITFRRYGSTKNIELMLNAEDATCSQTSVTFVAGKAISLPTPTRTGYAFVGWFDAAYDGNMISNGATTCNVNKLWAHWVDISSTPVIFNLISEQSETYSYNGNNVEATRYTYIVSNNRASGNMTFKFYVTSGSVYCGSGTGDVYLGTRTDTEWSQQVYMNQGVPQTIQIIVYNGSITSTRYQ